ncbi:MAG: hypothetical protein K9J12_09375 [Melioribacteraceae bacterium]|nr:hypothetical protein [Melioribacteraceae bacterium]MCF8432640.1 hypothetical protein [Melioribacteraceae bacterium]
MEKNNWQTKNKKNTLNLAVVMVIWLISMAVAAFGPRSIWNFNQELTLIAIIANFVLGIAVIFAYIRHIKGQDEMQQKIQLEAMAITLGVAVFGGLSYSLLDSTNVIHKAEISHIVILISITYMAALIIGRIRYK